MIYWCNGCTQFNYYYFTNLFIPQIDDLNGPYTTYCTNYRCGFDTWGPVQSNARLADILHNFSISSPPPSTSTASSTLDHPTWTLDDLFLLPKARLKYYKKLYSRLLKSTAPGRSDHRLLVGALDSLDSLLETLQSRASDTVGRSTSAPPLEPEDEVVIDLRTPSVFNSQDKKNGHPRTSIDKTPGSENSSTRGSSLSGGWVCFMIMSTSRLSNIDKQRPSVSRDSLDVRWQSFLCIYVNAGDRSRETACHWSNTWYLYNET